ncbi:hypothetical protein AHF37_10540 [Paragonimus kellicotti]|nr:hypothetical protein AHF37_10540 [Paragonimus kellicotti]
MILRTSRQLVRSMTSSAKLTKKLKLSKEAKKEIQKVEARSRKQDKKRALDDFPHYENTEISDYYFENGFRKVYPYHFVFKSYAKRRWLGRSICDVLLEEFNFPSQNVIPDRCLSGDLKVNDLPITPNYILQDSDLISHKVHRHELPVLNTPIKFVYEDDDVLVLSKPASIPVHPCGYPIVDDPLYNSTDWGEMKGKGAQYGISLDEIIRRISSNRTAASYLNENQPFTEPSHSFDRFKERISASSSLDSDTRDRLVRSFDQHCPDCRLCYRDPDIQHLVLRLHAYRYCGLDWSYVAPLPDWATGGMVSPSQDLNALVEAGISTLD